MDAQVEIARDDSEQEKNKQKLRVLAPEVFDEATLSSAIGEQLSAPTIVRVGINEDGTLEKYVARYTAAGRKYYLYLSKNTNHDMARVDADMRYMSDHMPSGSLPQPMFFFKKRHAIFYEGVPGENLLDAFPSTKQGRINVFRRLGERVRQFHNVPRKGLRTDDELDRSPLETLMQTVNKDSMAVVARRDARLFERLRVAMEKIISRERQLMRSRPLVLNHGDLHLGNITLDKNQQIGIMDLTDIIAAPREKDIGGLFEQMRSILPQYGHTSESEVEKFQEFFLDGYGRDEVDPALLRFYEAWQAWRNSMYFASKVDPEYDNAWAMLARVEQLLDDTESF